MDRFYTITIDTISITTDGTGGGDDCKLEVPNWEDLLTPVTGNSRPNADGSDDTQTYAWDAGKQFDVRVLTWLYKEQWDDLLALQIDSLQNNTAWTITGTGDTGDFTVTAKAFIDRPFSAAGFRNGRIIQPVFRFITT